MQKKGIALNGDGTFSLFYPRKESLVICVVTGVK